MSNLFISIINLNPFFLFLSRSRRPEWCDRILFQTNSRDNQSNITSYCYTSHSHYKQSDHKPVLSIFSIKVKDPLVNKRQEPFEVSFSSIPDWKVMKSSSAFIDIRNNHRAKRDSRHTDGIIPTFTNFDWVGLFPADFVSLNDYKSYVWVGNDMSSNDSDLFSYEDVSEYDGNSRSLINLDSNFRLKLDFDEDILLSPGEYKLVYVDQDGDVLAMSNNFKIKS